MDRQQAAGQDLGPPHPLGLRTWLWAPTNQTGQSTESGPSGEGRAPLRGHVVPTGGLFPWPLREAPAHRRPEPQLEGACVLGVARPTDLIPIDGSTARTLGSFPTNRPKEMTSCQ